MLFWYEVFYYWILLLFYMDFSLEYDRFDMVVGCIIFFIYWVLFIKSLIGLFGVMCVIFEWIWISCNLNEWLRRLSLFDWILIGFSIFWIIFLFGFFID